MNERLLEFLLKSEVEKLSEEKKSLYKFIVENEDLLAQQADTVNQFHQLLVHQSPYKLASRYFNIPYSIVFQLMNEIETELNINVEKRYEQSKWIDMTDRFSHRSIGAGERKVFLFIS